MVRIDDMNATREAARIDVCDDMSADRLLMGARTDDGDRARRRESVEAIGRHQYPLQHSAKLHRAVKVKSSPCRFCSSSAIGYQKAVVASLICVNVD